MKIDDIEIDQIRAKTDQEIRPEKFKFARADEKKKRYDTPQAQKRRTSAKRAAFAESEPLTPKQIKKMKQEIRAEETGALQDI